MQKFKHFVFGTLFDIHPTNAYKITNKDLYTVTGDTPVLSNSSVNNGIGGYCGLEPTESGNMITFSDTTTGADTMFYQPDPFIGYPHVQGLYAKGNHKWCEKEYLYLISVVRRAAGKGWSYSNKFTRKFVSELKVLLPVKDNLLLDVELMSEIIGGGISMSNIDTSSWKEFLITDLFELCPVKSKLTKLDLCNTGVVPVYSSETSNNGINGYTDVAAQFIVDEKTPLYLVFGDHTRSMNIAEESFCVMDNVKVLKPKCSVSVEMLLYISTVWKKAIPDLGYARHWSVAKDLSIKLPVKDVEEIDWEYMQERITELEQERITELEQYLIATGLNDYELTDEDKDILATKLTDGVVLQNSISGNGCLKEARMFRVGDLFMSRTGDTDLQKYHINGNGYYVVSSGLENNGVIGKTDVSAKIFDADTITIDMFGNCFYRDEQYKMVTHARVFSLLPLFGGLNRLNGQYIISQFKYLPSIYNYSNMCSWNKIQNDELCLPIQTDANNTPVIDQNHTYHPDGYVPDWIYMEKYICAIEKVVIKDVVDYKDSIIAKTKEIVA